jgi:hypothetical protein
LNEPTTTENSGILLKGARAGGRVIGVYRSDHIGSVPSDGTGAADEIVQG